MVRFIVLAALLAAAPCAALAADVPKEPPQPTIGGCVWAAKPELMRAYRAAMPNNYDMVKQGQARGAFIAAHQAELLAQAAVCEKRSDVSPTVSLIAISAEAAMQDDQLWVSPFDVLTRKDLDRLWTQASEGTRNCFRAQVNKSLGLAAPECINPKAIDSMPQAIAQMSHSANNPNNSHFADLEVQTAVDYYLSYARAELAQASFTKMPAPAAAAGN